MTATTLDSDRTATTDTVLEVRNARVTFDMARGRARVLDDVSVDVRRGETLAIGGESGSGKSMLGSVLLDAVPDPGQTSGEVIYHPPDGGDPVDVLDLSPRRLRRLRWEEIAMVSQAATNSFNPSITVRRHFTDTFDAHDVDRRQGLDRARELLARLSLDPERILDANQHELSGGEKQRAMLALALVFDPEVLVLDEPTAGLDLLVQREILSMLYEIKAEYDLTLVFISHDLPIVSGFADRLGVMYAFELVEVGDAQEILLDPEHPYTRLLSRATLEPGASLDAVRAIEGDPPDAVNVPTGCSFHPRCPVADERCQAETPELRAAEGGSKRVACFYPDRAADRIDHSPGASEADHSLEAGEVDRRE